MLSTSGLQSRERDLKLNLTLIQHKFNETKDLLKLLKIEINDTKGAILEIEKLLLQVD